MTNITEGAFETLADATLRELAERLEEVLGDTVDVEMQGSVLSIELESGGQYVINKHAPNRQIWMSSPESGATHYDYRPQEKGWFGTRDAIELRARLAGEMERATGVAVSFD